MSFPIEIFQDHFTLPQGIDILVMKIPGILDWILPGAVPDNYRTMGKKRFRKSDFSREILSKSELAYLNGFKALKKQAEWLSGRVALKTLLHKTIMPQTPMAGIGISYKDKGAPYVVQLPHAPISLSHSSRLTAAAVSRDFSLTIGLDLEKIGPCPDAHFLKTAFTTREINEMTVRARDIFANWTLKEAFLKYLKLGFNESLHQVEIINNKIYHKGECKRISTWSADIENQYVMSLVWK